MKLYGAMASPYVARVVMAARAKGLDLPLEPPPGGGLKSAEYLAINPIGKMPVLEDGGRHVVESEVIVEYLDETHPQLKLLPADPMERAQSRTLSRLMDLYVAPQGGGFFRNMNPATRNQAEVDASREGLRKALGYVEHFMGSGPYAVGKHMTPADCAIFTHGLILSALLPAFGIQDMFADLPKLSAWWRFMNGEPTAKRVAADYQEALAAFLKSRS